MSAAADHYQVLGLRPTATQEQITEAYKSLILASHPDKAAPDKQEEANAKTALINAAYDTLKNPSKRKEYDRKRAGAKQSPRVRFQPSPPVSPGGRQNPEPSTPRRMSASNMQRPVNRPEPPAVNAQRTSNWVYQTRSAFRPVRTPAYTRPPTPVPTRSNSEGPNANPLTTSHGNYYPKHDPEHLFLSVGGITVPVKHSLRSHERDLLRLLMLAHRYNLTVVEYPFQQGTDRDHFVFTGPGIFGRVKVYLDATQAPPS